MKQHNAVVSLIRESEAQHRCLYGPDDASRRALKRRHHVGELLSPYPNVYVRPGFWEPLSACQRSLCMARTLHLMHPTWVFAGLTAADAYGFEHTWRLHERIMTIADPHGRKGRPENPPGTYALQRLFVPASATTAVVAGIPVTDAVRTLIDCALRFPFPHALPMFDAAIRKGVSMDDVRSACSRLRIDRTPVTRVLTYANGKCENGGESMVYALIVLNGFAVPEFQVEFRTRDRLFRVDFLWRRHDGRIIVLEYDGMRKYSDSSMAGRRSVKQVVGEQMERDQSLRALGVTTIVHCGYDDVITQMPLVRKLTEAEVPWVGRPW